MYIDVDSKKPMQQLEAKINRGNRRILHGTADHRMDFSGRHFARKGLNIHAVDFPGLRSEDPC